MTAPRPLLVFADDWGRHPSSCQHLIRQLLPRREVVWVNTIGTRPPRLDWSTVQRVAGKLKQWSKPGELAVPDDTLRPQILSPKMWPSFRSRFGRGLNRRMLSNALRPVIAAMPQPPVIVTTLPLVADLVGVWPGVRWVYYCVDDFSVWPGYDGETMLKMEREFVPKVDAVVAVSETLREHVLKLGKPSTLLTHGVDLDHWRGNSERESVPELAGLAAPLVLFWGVIDRRLDMDFVRHLANNLKGGTLAFVGPQEDPDPELTKLPNVVFRSPVAFERLPSFARQAAVLVMPYADLPVTRAMQPLKFKEYLATGRPTVVRDLPSTREWADAADVVRTQEEFAARVLERIAGGLPAGQRLARERLSSESWAGKATEFEKVLDDFPAADETRSTFN